MTFFLALPSASNKHKNGGGIESIFSAMGRLASRKPYEKVAPTGSKSDTLTPQTSDNSRKTSGTQIAVLRTDSVSQKTIENSTSGVLSLNGSKFMRSATQHLPVILVLGKRSKNHDEVDEWLAGSRYSTHEAKDVFQALEQVSDFTVRETPDVVYLHVDRMDTELAMLEHMLVSAVGEPCASVVAFSDLESTGKDAGGFGGLERQLDRLIPCPSLSQAN